MKKTIKNLSILMAATVFLFSACSKNDTEDSSSNVPSVSVNVSLNINSTGYTTLNTIGGIAYLTNVGYRGIMLYRLNTSTIMAYDRTCTYDLSDANGIVDALTNGTAMCLECNSVYNLNDGSVNTGPTTIGLKVYATTFNSTSGALKITN